MRNLVLVHYKRFFFRWETFAVTLLNLFLGICSTIFAVILCDPLSISYFDFNTIIYAVTVVSLCCTAAAVTFIEINTLSTGAVRNPLIAGYSKAKVFISKYIAAAVFSMTQCAITFVPSLLANRWVRNPVRFTVSMLLMYASISCILMAVCLLSDRPTVYTVIAIGCLLLFNAGGDTFSRLLTQRQYVEVWFDSDTETVQRFENPRYVSSPARDMIDQTLRISPIQPLSEYFEWYIPKDVRDYQDSVDFFEKRIAESDNEMQRESRQFELDNYKLEYGSHLNRIVVFPYYQSAFLIAFGIGGALVFRKRNLK